MSEKLSVAEFATLVGTTAKTIYSRISNNSNLPVNEQLKTVNEKIKGRDVTLILTNSEQLEIYKKIYGKDNVINREYYENVTVNDDTKPVNNINEPVKNNEDNTFNNSVIDRLLNVNEDYNNRLLQLSNELITAKQNQLLLEDKASREGLYINEINELKKVNNSKDKLIKVLITLIITLLTVIIISITVLLTLNYVNNSNNPETENPSIEQVSTVENVNNEN